MPRLTMPGFEDLTPDQDRVLRLPDEGRYLVYGPPGTGKTVVALLRAVAMGQRNRPPVILMFNRLLNEFCQQMLAGRKIILKVQRYHSWFCIHYKRIYGDWPPEIHDVKGKPKKYKYDWQMISHACAAKIPPIVPSVTPLFIDEGQDLPPGFYEYAGLHFRNIMVFADENQMLNEEVNSRIETICERLQIHAPNRFLLKTNQRNTRQIALVAEKFYVGTQSGKPELPDREGPIPLLIDYDDVGYFAERVVRHAGIHPDSLVAVVTANNPSLDLMNAKLGPRCTESGVLFRTYRSTNRVRIDFRQPGVLLLNQQNLKGLEFDSLIISDLHEHFIRQDGLAHKMILYVATSRARERLIVCRNRERRCPLLESMPGPEVMKPFALVKQGVKP